MTVLELEVGGGVSSLITDRVMQCSFHPEHRASDEDPPWVYSKIPPPSEQLLTFGLGRSVLREG